MYQWVVPTRQKVNFHFSLFTDTHSTPEKPPLISALDDTPQSSPVLDNPKLSTPKSEDHIALTIVDLSIAEEPLSQVGVYSVCGSLIF